MDDNVPVGVITSHSELDDLNPADEHTVLRKLADIPEYQTWMKNRVGHLPDVTITGQAGENNCISSTFDGTYVWIGLDVSPAKILKIDPSDNSYITITAAGGENACVSLTFDGTYIWAGLYISPAKILKINPVDNSYTVITATGGENACETLTFDGTHMWAGLDTSPAKVLKIDPSDNSYTTITAAGGEEYCLSSTFDGTYVWVACNTSPTKILKIDPSDNSYTTFTASAGDNWCWSLAFDGTYIWAGLYLTPAKILKINPVDNSYTVITGAVGENASVTLTFDGTYIWAGLFLTPVKILKIFAHKRTLDITNRRPPEMFMDLLAASATGVHAAVAGTGALQTITTSITNPDVPRNISITTTNNATPSGTVTITGKLANGQVSTEDITISAGTTAYGNKAFATVTSFTVPAGVTAADTVAVGFSDKIGVSSLSASALYKVKENNADVTGTYSLNTTYFTIDLATINAGDDFTIWYHADD